MVDSFNVSLSASFTRKNYSDQARIERNVETVYQSCPTNQVSEFRRLHSFLRDLECSLHMFMKCWFLVDGKTINNKHKVVTIGFFFTDNMFRTLTLQVQ